MKFFLSDGLGGVEAKLPPILRRVCALLDKAADGELFTTQELTRRLTCRSTTLSRDSYLVSAYWHILPPNRKYWGKPTTIQQLKREVKLK